MMLDWLGEQEKATRLEAAVAAVIAEGKVRTYDMGGSSTTAEMATGASRQALRSGDTTDEEDHGSAQGDHGAPARGAARLPRCLSAKIIEACGFEAIQISGFGLAGSLLARPDVGLVQMKDVLDLTWNIAQAVSIPVMADMDTGGGNAVNAAWITERLIAMGVAGMNIEDQVFPKRCGHMAGKEVIGAEEMAGKVRACADVRDRLDRDFIINARTDVFAVAGIDEAIRRCNLYLEAGADLAFIDGIRTPRRHREGREAGQGPALRQPDGRDQRREDGAGADPGAGEDGRGPRLDPGRLDHGRAQGALRLLQGAQGLADRQPGRPDSSGSRPSRSTPTSSACRSTGSCEDQYLPKATIESKYKSEA